MASVKYDTILSNFEGKLTLMQWLKACDASLKTLTEDFSTMSEDLEGLRNDLDETQEFANSLNQRLTAVEERALFVESETDALRGITTDLDTRVTALENAPAGGGLYKHTLSGQTSTMDNIYYVIDGDATPITASNFITRMQNALVIQASTRQPFTNYCAQNGDYSANMSWQSGPTTLASVTINFQNVSDSVTAL